MQNECFWGYTGISHSLCPSMYLSAVLSISGRRHVLRPDFEIKHWHFESQTFFHVQILTKMS